MCDSNKSLSKASNLDQKACRGRRIRWRMASFSHLLQLLTTPSSKIKNLCTFFPTPIMPKQVLLGGQGAFMCLMNLLWVQCSLAVELWLYFCKNVYNCEIHSFLSPQSCTTGPFTRRTKNQRGKKENEQLRDICVAWLFSGRKDLGYVQTWKRKSSLLVNSAFSFLFLFPLVLNIILVCWKN